MFVWVARGSVALAPVLLVTWSRWCQMQCLSPFRATPPVGMRVYCVPFDNKVPVQLQCCRHVRHSGPASTCVAGCGVCVGLTSYPAPGGRNSAVVSQIGGADISKASIASTAVACAAVITPAVVVVAAGSVASSPVLLVTSIVSVPMLSTPRFVTPVAALSRAVCLPQTSNQQGLLPEEWLRHHRR